MTAREKISKTLLKFDSNNPEHTKIIKSLRKKYDGFAPASDQDYTVAFDNIHVSFSYTRL